MVEREQLSDFGKEKKSKRKRQSRRTIKPEAALKPKEEKPEYSNLPEEIIAKMQEDELRRRSGI